MEQKCRSHNSQTLCSFHLSTVYFMILISFGFILILTRNMSLKLIVGQPRWPRPSGLVLPSAQGVILETRNQVPRRAPCMQPASPSACVSAFLSLCLS